MKASALYFENLTVAAGICYEAVDRDFVTFGTGQVIIFENGMHTFFTKGTNSVSMLQTEHLSVAGLPEKGRIRRSQVVVEFNVSFFHKIIIAIFGGGVRNRSAIAGFSPEI